MSNEVRSSDANSIMSALFRGRGGSSGVYQDDLGELNLRTGEFRTIIQQSSDGLSNDGPFARGKPPLTSKYLIDPCVGAT